MGHLINPITYRLGKTKFWNYTWANKTKKNYKNLLIEDLNFYKFSKWLLSILSWHKIGVFIHDFKIIKNFNSLDFCLFFFLKRLNLSNIYKKSFFSFFIKNSFLNFFFKTLSYKKLNSYKSFFLLKKKKQNIFVQTIKKKKLYFRKKKLLKIFFKTNIKKKKKNKKKLWLNSFLFNYCTSMLKKNKIYKKKFIKKFNSYFLFKSLRINFFLLKSFSSNSILQKNFLSRALNYKFFFRVLTFFLTFFIKNIFKHERVNFSFFQKNVYFLNSNSIKKFIRYNMANSRNKVSQVVKKVFRKTKRKYYILGLKIGFFGRYEKKLRNKNVWQMRGSLSPSNINTPITHKNFCILLKQGLCGVKISFLNKLKKNEIFKKKTFINKTFEF